MTGQRKDALGRPAVGVSLGDVTLLFDSGDYRLLETRYTLGEGGETRITRVRHAVVGSDRARR